MELIINLGSSSVKCALFDGEKRIWEAHTEGSDLKAALATLPKVELNLIGHRVVHGGERFIHPTRITAEVKAQIHELAYLAPLHNPLNLQGIDIAEQLFPSVPQFAVFDTAFHATLSQEAALYPIPLMWKQKGIRRYGFHGINHAYCARHAPPECKNLIICHLGAGSSLCAVKEGKSIDTTMGLTPLEGLMMATRSGSIDPGLLTHLLLQEKMSPESLDQMLNHQSGLLGISGESSDVGTLLSSKTPEAKLALAMFVHSLKKHIGMMLATLGSLDALIFTAGIGEHAAPIRSEACAAFSFLGLKIDAEKNQANAPEISTQDSSVRVLVIPANEELEIKTQLS